MEGRGEARRCDQTRWEAMGGDGGEGEGGSISKRISQADHLMHKRQKQRTMAVMAVRDQNDFSSAAGGVEIA